MDKEDILALLKEIGILDIPKNVEQRLLMLSNIKVTQNSYFPSGWN